MTIRKTGYWALAGCFGLIISMPAAPVETDPATKIMIAGATFGLEKLGKWISKQYYKDFHCAQEVRDGWSFVCGALHDYSGGKEQEWKENVTAQLSAIRDELAEVKQGQDAMQRQLNSLVSQNRELLAKLDELVDESVIQPEIRKIQALWSDQFAPLYADYSSFSRERLLRFARQVVHTHQMHVKLGEIGKTLTTRGVGGKPPLLRLYAERLKLQINPGNDPMLMRGYEYLEGVMADLLLEQRKAYLMYQFAAEVLESECQLRGCGNDGQPPIPALEYEKTFAAQIADELEAFNETVEWLVLASSDPLVCQADFLPEKASQIFWRADWLTAVTLGRFGLMGRVISMGNRFGGQLQWSPYQTGGTALPLASSKQVTVRADQGMLDWWNSSQNNLVFDEVHFSDEWRIFRYQQADWKPGLYSLDTLVPYKPFTVPVAAMDLATGEATDAAPSEEVAVFGSFAAVDRAGGCYALTSGPWMKVDKSDPASEAVIISPTATIPDFSKSSFDTLIEKIKGLLSNGQVSVSYNEGTMSDNNPLAIGVESRGEVRWVAGKVTGRQSAQWEQILWMTTHKKIRYPEARAVSVGGNVKLNAVLKPVFRVKGAKYPPSNDFDYYPDYGLLGMKTNFHLGGINPKSAKYQGRISLVFGDFKSNNGLVWEETKEFSSPGVYTLKKSMDSRGILLQADQSYPLSLYARTSVEQEPAGFDATSWMIKAKASFDRVYLSWLGPK
jgi:hypothetical protein